MNILYDKLGIAPPPPEEQNDGNTRSGEWQPAMHAPVQRLVQLQEAVARTSKAHAAAREDYLASLQDVEGQRARATDACQRWVSKVVQLCMYEAVARHLRAAAANGQDAMLHLWRGFDLAQPMPADAGERQRQFAGVRLLDVARQAYALLMRVYRARVDNNPGIDHGAALMASALEQGAAAPLPPLPDRAEACRATMHTTIAQADLPDAQARVQRLAVYEALMDESHRQLAAWADSLRVEVANDVAQHGRLLQKDDPSTPGALPCPDAARCTRPALTYALGPLPGWSRQWRALRDFFVRCESPMSEESATAWENAPLGRVVDDAGRYPGGQRLKLAFRYAFQDDRGVMHAAVPLFPPYTAVRDAINVLRHLDGDDDSPGNVERRLYWTVKHYLAHGSSNAQDRLRRPLAPSLCATAVGNSQVLCALTGIALQMGAIHNKPSHNMWYTDEHEYVTDPAHEYDLAKRFAVRAAPLDRQRRERKLNTEHVLPKQSYVKEDLQYTGPRDAINYKSFFEKWPTTGRQRLRNGQASWEPVLEGAPLRAIAQKWRRYQIAGNDVYNTILACSAANELRGQMPLCLWELRASVEDSIAKCVQRMNSSLGDRIKTEKVSVAAAGYYLTRCQVRFMAVQENSAGAGACRYVPAQDYAKPNARLIKTEDELRMNDGAALTKEQRDELEAARRVAVCYWVPPLSTRPMLARAWLYTRLTYSMLQPICMPTTFQLEKLDAILALADPRTHAPTDYEQCANDSREAAFRWRNPLLNVSTWNRLCGGRGRYNYNTDEWQALKRILTCTGFAGEGVMDPLAPDYVWSRTEEAEAALREIYPTAEDAVVVEQFNEARQRCETLTATTNLAR
jgi:hypothetical protein